MLRGLWVGFALLACSSSVLEAQTCLRSKPAPACSSWWIIEPYIGSVSNQGVSFPGEPRHSAAEITGPVFVLTDHTCASACLDAVDLLLAAGAIQIGRETSGDTPYLEVRSETLPSGLGSIVFPTKVYRGRSRGVNEPYAPAPDRVWEGSLSDTAGLEVWVERLADAMAAPRTRG